MYKPAGGGRGGLYLEGQFNGGFFTLPDWGAYFRNFTVVGSTAELRLARTRK